MKSIGPAIIVAAVVLGPGSILTSSKVGASFGLIGFPVVVIAAVLMISMVALAARLGVVYEGSPCDELTKRLGRPVAVFIGLTLFVLVAFFQSSNNIALVAGVEPLFYDAAAAAKDPSGAKFSFPLRCTVLVVANLFVVACLYLLRNLYKSVESGMKILMGMMLAAFLLNFVVIFLKPRPLETVETQANLDLLPLLGMIGTTFSVGGAFYQAYLVKEKGWTLKEAREGVVDSILSISMLGLVTCIILLTSWRIFYGTGAADTLTSVDAIARQLEPLFGPVAKIIFCSGILAGAVSSFMVNAMIGGTIMSDSLGWGSKLEDRWPLHLTTLGLLIGMSVALASLAKEGSTVYLIMLAQALTVLGLPALALSLIYLGTRSELQGPRKIPTPILSLAIVGFFVSCVFAYLTASNVYSKLFPKEEQTAAVTAPAEPGDNNATSSEAKP